MSAVIPTLTGIEFRPAAATSPRALVTRLTETAPPSTRWTPADDPNAVAYPVREWSPPMNRLDLEVTMRLGSGGETWIAATPSANSSSILGRLEPMCVNGQAGELVTVRALFTGVALTRAAVGSHLLEWEWRVGVRPDAVEELFATTRHRVYTTVDQPREPWGDHSLPDADCPWIAALEWACEWAAGEREEEGVVARITREIASLGGMPITVNGMPTRFLYSPMAFFVVPSLSMRIFRLTRFLSLLTRTTTITDGRANCADLAAAVAVFANLLGCRVQQAQFAATSGNFPLNGVRVFGLDETESAPHTAGGFDFHRAAKRPGPAKPLLYDACLALDICGDPAAPPFCWSPAVAMPLQSPGALGYAERLIAPQARATVHVSDVAIPGVKRAAPPPPFIDPVIRHRFDAYRTQLQALVPAAARLSGLSLDARPELVLLDQLPWLTDSHGPLPARRFVARDPERPLALVRLQEISCSSVRQAIEVAAESLTASASPFTAVLPATSMAALSDASRHEAVFVSELRVILVSSIGAADVDVVQFARDLLDL